MPGRTQASLMYLLWCWSRERLGDSVLVPDGVYSWTCRGSKGQVVVHGVLDVFVASVGLRFIRCLGLQSGVKSRFALVSVSARGKRRNLSAREART